MCRKEGALFYKRAALTRIPELLRQLETEPRGEGCGGAQRGGRQLGGAQGGRCWPQLTGWAEVFLQADRGPEHEIPEAGAPLTSMPSTPSQALPGENGHGPESNHQAREGWTYHNHLLLITGRHQSVLDRGADRSPPRLGFLMPSGGQICGVQLQHQELKTRPSVPTLCTTTGCSKT